MTSMPNRATPRRRPAKWVATLVLVAATGSALLDRERHPIGGRAVLVGVATGLGMLHLRDRRLIAVALAFAGASWAADAEPPRWASGGVKALAALHVPPPDDRPPADFIERGERNAARARFEEEYRLYGFALLNLAAFLTLLAASPLLRRGRIEPPRDVARS